MPSPQPTSSRSKKPGIFPGVGVGLIMVLVAWAGMLFFAIAWQQRMRSNPMYGATGALGFLFWFVGRALCFGLADKPARKVLGFSLLNDIALFFWMSENNGEFHDGEVQVALGLGLLLWLAFLKRLSRLCGVELLEKRAGRSFGLGCVALGLMVLFHLFPQILALWYLFVLGFVVVLVSSFFLTLHAATTVLR